MIFNEIRNTRIIPAQSVTHDSTRGSGEKPCCQSHNAHKNNGFQISYHLCPPIHLLLEKCCLRINLMAAPIIYELIFCIIQFA